MRRAVLSLRQHLLSVSLGSCALAMAAALALTGACSVYSSALLEESTGITSGGSGAEEAGGRAGTSGGTPGNAAGKTSGETPSGGGDDSVDPGTGQSDAGTGGTSNGGVSAVGGGGTMGGVAGTDASGGTAGSSSGAGGSAGSVAASPLIDGFDDDDLTLEETDGRSGVWYLVGDGSTGTLGPDPLACSANVGAPADLGAYAMHITATGFTGSGSILGADFRDKKKVYDASRFTGIRFWAKVGSGKNTKHRVQIADATTDEAGGLCSAAAGAADAVKCGNHFGVNETFTTSWAAYSITFEQMTQSGSWGQTAPAIDKAHVYGLQITAKANMAVDLWLDQLEFF